MAIVIAGNTFSYWSLENVSFLELAKSDFTRFINEIPSASISKTAIRDILHIKDKEYIIINFKDKEKIKQTFLENGELLKEYIRQDHAYGVLYLLTTDEQVELLKKYPDLPYSDYLIQGYISHYMGGTKRDKHFFKYMFDESEKNFDKCCDVCKVSITTRFAAKPWTLQFYLANKEKFVDAPVDTRLEQKFTDYIVSDFIKLFQQINQ